MGCLMPNLDGVILTDELRRKVFERYYVLLQKVFEVPLWTSYYNTQLVAWLYTTQPGFARAGKPDPSASAVVRYLLRTYAAGDGGFLFGETRRADFVRALENHAPANYLFAYVAAALNSRPPPEECRSGLWGDVAAAVADCLRRPECWKHVENRVRGGVHSPAPQRAVRPGVFWPTFKPGLNSRSNR